MNKRFLGATVAALTLASTAAMASTYSEVGDASHTIAGAQHVTDGTTSISGTLGYGGDVDIYAFSLNSTTSLVIDGLGWYSSSIDSNLILMDGSGFGIEGDDDGGASLEARISISLSAGDYLIGFGDNNVYARSSSGAYVFNNDSGYIGGSGTAASYLVGGNSSGAYRVNFSSAVSDTYTPAVPLPAGLPLMFAGLGALGLLRSRKK